MITRDSLQVYLNKYLICSNFSEDAAVNGLQIEGKNEIHSICTAVTASQDAIDAACDADALLVHHGLFWRGDTAVITGMKRRRIGALLQNNLNLFAYHLPLDCHLDLGNNARLASILQLTDIKTHRAGRVDNLLWSGTLNTPMTKKELASHISQALCQSPQQVLGGADIIKSVAWCSGAAQDFIEDAYKLGANAYISGEISERTYYLAKELGINYYACGHHATERYGIQALGQHLADKFSLKVTFIDSNNPI